jgi:hypothetical protein
MMAYHSRRFSLFVVGLLALANAGSEEDRMRSNPLAKATEHMGADDLHTFFELLDINGNGKVSERDIRVAVDAAMVAEDAVESESEARAVKPELPELPPPPTLNASLNAPQPPHSWTPQFNTSSVSDVDYLQTAAPYSSFAPKSEAELFTRWGYERDALPRRKKTATEKLCAGSVYSEVRIQWLMDYFPTKLQGGGSLHNIGDKMDKDYIWINAHRIKDGAVLGVLPRDMPLFIETIFNKLPMSARVTVVNTHDDWSNPIEIFTGGARKRSPGYMEVAWGKSEDSRAERLEKLKNFIGDKRLKHWYVQNYDLLGCSFWTNSEIYEFKEGFSSTHRAFQKVSPIPIGSGMYAVNCRKDDGDDQAMRKVGGFKPWAQRRASIFGGGESMKTNDFKLSRRAMNDALGKSPSRLVYNRMPQQGNSDVDGMNKNVKKYFETVTSCQFAIAPHGNGQDTHRIWEILNLGTVPVVLTSHLDLLYSNFPIVIIDEVKELWDPDFVQKWTKRLMARWGPEPVSIEVRKRLRVMWWVDKVRDGSPVANAANIQQYISGADTRAKAWPICSIPECKPSRVEKEHKDCERKVLKAAF